MKNYKSFMTGWAFSLISFFPQRVLDVSIPSSTDTSLADSSNNKLTHKFSAVELDCFILFAPAALSRQDVT